MILLHLTTRIAKIKKNGGGWGPDAGEDVEWLELSYTWGGNTKCCNHFSKQSGSYKLTHLTCVPAIPLQREMKIYVHKNTCKRVFTAAVFVIVKTEKQPKGP